MGRPATREQAITAVEAWADYSDHPAALLARIEEFDEYNATEVVEKDIP